MIDIFDEKIGQSILDSHLVAILSAEKALNAPSAMTHSKGPDQCKGKTECPSRTYQVRYSDHDVRKIDHGVKN